jgi:hypothetical protein
MPLSRMVQACMPPLAVQRPAECDAASPVGSTAAVAPGRRNEEASTRLLHFRPPRPNESCIPGTGAFCFRLLDPFMTRV